MSRPVRIRPDVAARVQAVADGERRSFANMVEVLLLSALTERGGPSVAKSSDARESLSPRSVSADRPVTHNRRHMRADRPALECSSTDLPCGVCGAD